MIASEHSFSLRRVALLAGLFTAVAFHPELAAAQPQTEWIAAEVSGQASQQGADGSWHPVTSGSALVLGMPVKTGSDGRLVVTHDNDRLTVSPGSEFVIPQNVDAATEPSILQRLGTLLFKIEHTPDRRFEVKAPYLAAVVKGTVFTVSAGGADDKVHVAEGAVEVAAAVSHELVLLRPGQTAVVSSAGRDLSVLGRHGSAADPRHGDRATAEARIIEANATGGPMGTPRIMQPLGDLHPNIADLSNGLVADGAVSRATGNVRHAALESDVGTASDATTPAAGNGDAAHSNGTAANANAAGGNPNASGGNANATGGNPNAASGNSEAGGGNSDAGHGNSDAGHGNSNAGGGNANAAGGNPNAAGGNQNAAGGNPNAAGGNPNAAGGNPNAAGGNSNAAGGNSNAAGGNPNAGGANGVGNSSAQGNASIATASATSGGKGKSKVK